MTTFNQEFCEPETCRRCGNWLHPLDGDVCGACEETADKVPIYLVTDDGSSPQLVCLMAVPGDDLIPF